MVASFVLGVLSIAVFTIGWVPGGFAIVFGTIGIRKASGGAPHKGLAAWGTALGIVGTIIGLFVSIALGVFDT